MSVFSGSFGFSGYNLDYPILDASHHQVLVISESVWPKLVCPVYNDVPTPGTAEV